MPWSVIRPPQPKRFQGRVCKMMYACVSESGHVDFQMAQAGEGGKSLCTPVTHVAAALQAHIPQRQVGKFSEIALDVRVGEIQIVQFPQRFQVPKHAVINRHFAENETL